jgi:hypothetical protein
LGAGQPDSARRASADDEDAGSTRAADCDNQPTVKEYRCL